MMRASPRGDAPASATIEALAGAVASEGRLLEELVGVMQRQRERVAADDLEGVDDTVFATHRILVTLGEARRQRRTLGTLVAGVDDPGVRALEEELADRMTEGLRNALVEMRDAARRLSREVAMNRKILRSALSTGGEMVLGMLSPPEAGQTYGATPGQGVGRAGGVLLDRQA